MKLSRPVAMLSVIGGVAGGGCADLAMEPDQVPTSMSIAPFDTLITEGDELRLRVNVEDQDGNVMAGPPTWALPAWTVSDEGAVDVAPEGVVTGLRGSELTLTATVAGLEAWTKLRVNPSSVALSAPLVYLTQGAQNVNGTVPLIAGRQALLRVFAVGDEVSFYEPKVRAAFFQEGREVHQVRIDALSEMLPAKVDESRLDRSYNAIIPGSVLQPGVELVVELDPEGVVPQAPGSKPRYPAEGGRRLDVRALPRLDQTMVPVLLASNPDERVFNWTNGMTPESRQLHLARSTLPIGEMSVTVHEPYVSSADLTTSAGWNQLILEIRVMHYAEGQKGYYYGVAELPSRSLYGGLGYVGFPVSIGATRGDVYAHELGHNLNLLHAPCGGAGGPDPGYPYDGGSIGIWGYDLRRSRLVDPSQYKDLMGYCSPDWISDYFFTQAMDHRLATEAALAFPSRKTGPSAEKTLLLWGSAGDGELFLEPAFLIDGPVALPGEGGPYQLEGFGPGGLRHFAFDFTPTPLEFGGGHFLFAVPFDPDRDGAVERVVLSGPEGLSTLERSSANPMAIIRNRATGQVRAMVRDWTGASMLLPDGNMDVLVSTGLPGGGR